MSDSGERFNPNWISPPGETIGDILRQKDLTQADFGERIGADPATVRDLLEGRQPISGSLAQQLETTLGAPASFWLKREKTYRHELRRLEAYVAEEEVDTWLKSLPVAEMTRMGWLPAAGSRTDRAVACLRFFGVPDVRSWFAEYDSLLRSSAFRTSRSYESTPGSVAVWLRQGELEAASIGCMPWNPVKFKDVLRELRALTREDNPSVFLPELRQRLSECGVAAVALKAPSGCRASGVARFLTQKKALMLLSFRYLSNDQFWFSVFHEAGHLLLHPERLSIDSPGMPSSKEENEANEFAAEILIPKEFEAEMMKLPVDGRAVMKFARRIGVAPGIVVGQLQHRGQLQRRQLNNLKRRYAWKEN